MSFSLSPSVEFTEVDLTGIVPQVSSTGGSYVGDFKWGPLLTRKLIDNESVLVSTYGKPDANTNIDWYMVYNFLQYGNNIRVVRVAPAGTLNATSSGTGIQIKNEEDYELNYPIGANTAYGPIYARYPGDLGNSLKVGVCSSTAGFKKTTVTANTIISSNIVTSSANVQSYASVGDSLTVNLTDYTILSFGAANTININAKTTITANMTAMTTAWEYAPYFDSAPTTSTYANNQGGSLDEMHIIVIDEDGKISGTKNTVLERYQHVSKGVDAMNDDNSPNYWDIKLLNESKYVYAADHLPNCGTTWGLPVAGIAFDSVANYKVSLSGGVIATPTDSDKEIGWDLFKNGDEVDTSLLIGGAASLALADYILGISTQRRDCVAFISPLKQDAVSSVSMDNIIAFRQSLSVSNSYGVMDSGWKYQLDKYNNKYIWVPLNADIAGLCVRTDNLRDPWWSPAGFNRGQILGAVKVSWNPTKAQRDELFKNNVNPVLAFPGEGIVLFGDKTLQQKASAFDAINVRRLFIVLEKAISTASKYYLFEFNDEFTRNSFVNMVNPYLRSVKGRRGITDFFVQCDTTNNTPQVIDSNQFVASIFIKPARAIRYIQLYFVATPTGVSFSEVQNFGQ